MPYCDGKFSNKPISPKKLLKRCCDKTTCFRITWLNKQIEINSDRNLKLALEILNFFAKHPKKRKIVADKNTPKKSSLKVLLSSYKICGGGHACEKEKVDLIKIAKYQIRKLAEMIDIGNVRLEIIEGTKFPKCKSGTKSWTVWWEVKSAEELLNKTGEVGVRTGIKVRSPYNGEWYYLYCLDDDYFHKEKKLTEEERKYWERQCQERNRKWGVGYIQSKGGMKTLILSKEPIDNFKGLKVEGISEKVLLSDFLGRGKQFLFLNGRDRIWYADKYMFLVVKNKSHLISKLKDFPYSLINKNEVNFLPKQVREKEQNVRESLIEGFEQSQVGSNYPPITKSVWNEVLVGFKFLYKKWTSMYEPVKMFCKSGLSFIANIYYSNQKKLLQKVNDPPLEIEINHGQFLNFFSRTI